MEIISINLELSKYFISNYTQKPKSLIYNIIRFESCWPTVQKDINGLIFVYNPFINDHSKELELLYNYFVTQTKIHPDNCLVFAHIKQPDSNEPKNFVKLCKYYFT